MFATHSDEAKALIEIDVNQKGLFSDSKIQDKGVGNEIKAPNSLFLGQKAQEKGPGMLFSQPNKPKNKFSSVLDSQQTFLSIAPPINTSENQKSLFGINESTFNSKIPQGSLFGSAYKENFQGTLFRTKTFSIEKSDSLNTQTTEISNDKRGFSHGIVGSQTKKSKK